MTLQQRAEALSNAIRNAAELKQQNEEAKKISDRTEQLIKLRERAARIRDCAQKLTAHKWAHEEPDAEDVLLRVAAYRAALAEGSERAVEWQKCIRALTKHIDNREKHYNAALSRVIEAVSLLRVEDLSGLASAFGKAAECREALAEQRFLLNAPWGKAAASELNELLTRYERCRSFVTELTEADAPDGVRTFLNRARMGEARVDELTAEVRGWLDARGLTAQLRLTLNGKGT